MMGRWGGMGTGSVEMGWLVSVYSWGGIGVVSGQIGWDGVVATTLQLPHCSYHTAATTLQLLHCSYYTAAATLQLLHCSCYTAATTLQLLPLRVARHPLASPPRV